MVLLAILATESFHGGATLVSSESSVAPGSSFEVAVRIALDPGWHTYWQNPGDAGIPPKISWNLPVGWKAGDIEWPIPHKLIAPEVVSFGYEHEALLLVKLTAPKSAQPGSKVSLKAKVDWLVCQEGCIPATASVRDDIKISTAPRSDPLWVGRILKAVQNLPAPAVKGKFSATMSGTTIVLSFAKRGDLNPGSVTFFPADPVVEPSAPQTLITSGGKSTLTLKLSQFAPASVPRLRGLLVSQRGANISSQTIDIPLLRRNL